MKEKVMQGKPYAGNPHVRLDERAGFKLSLLVGVSAVFGMLVAATPSSVPAWIDINAQIPARTDQASCSVAFTTSADGHDVDEEIGGTWTMSTMQCGCMVIFR